MPRASRPGLPTGTACKIGSASRSVFWKSELVSLMTPRIIRMSTCSRRRAVKPIRTVTALHMKTSGGGDQKDEGRRWKCKNYTLPSLCGRPMRLRKAWGRIAFGKALAPRLAYQPGWLFAAVGGGVAMKRTKNLIMFAALSLLLIGWSTERTTTTVTTDTKPLPPASDESTPPSQTTTTTAKTTTDQPQSVLRPTANAVVTAILLPFRVVGDTLELIF